MIVAERVFDETIELKDNAMLKVRPDLFDEWDFDKNDELGFDVYKVTKGSVKKVWWICPKCKSRYYATTNNRISNCNCPYCAGKKVNHTNSIASLSPDIAREWHPTKNGDLTSHDVTVGSNKKVWWLGECAHEWESTTNHRISKGSSCPYCSSNKVLVGFNDMWTTIPEIAKLLLTPEDGYKYSQNSHEKLNWKCDHCGEIIMNKRVSSINKQGLSCLRCSDGMSYPEKFMSKLLTNLNVKFKKEVKFKWSQGKRYDYYFKHNGETYIIEIHGEQHYNGNFKSVGGRNLQDEQENDDLKMILSKENGIDNFIVINARHSDIDWMKESVLNSVLFYVFDLNKVDWIKIEEGISTTLVKSVCSLWTSGIKNVMEIGKELDLSSSTVRKYLKQGERLGWCEYEVMGAFEFAKKKVVRLSLDGRETVEYASISIAEKENNFKSRGGISKVCRGKQRSYGGYTFMYYEDFQEYLKGKRSLFQIPKKEKSVVQLSLDGIFMHEFTSISEASKILNIDYRLIHRVCTKGKDKRWITNGFKWMYKEDYEKLLLDFEDINMV